MFGAQSYRPMGTAAQLVVVPSPQAVDLAANVPFGQTAQAHDRVDAGSRGRILIEIPD